MSKNKKRKKHKRVPPLSAGDTCVYLLLFVLIAVITVGFAVLIVEWQNRIAESDPSVIAHTSHASSLFGYVFIIYLFISGIVFAVCMYTERKPIFGNKKIAYGKEPWDKNCIPLFDPARKTRYVPPSHKKRRREYLCLWFAGLAVTLLFLPLGLSGRTCLSEDDRITVYNMFGAVTGEYTSDDFSSLTPEARHVTSKSSRYYTYGITVGMRDGRKFSFFAGDFTAHDDRTVLEEMTGIKGFFRNDQRITYKGTEFTEKVVSDRKLSPEEAELLYALFAE